MIFTVKEAALERRCSTKTIYTYIREYQATKHLRNPRGLKATRTRPHSPWIIKESDLIKWMEGE